MISLPRRLFGHSCLPNSLQRRTDVKLLAFAAVAAPSLGLFDALGIATLMAVVAVGLLAAGGWRDFPPRVFDRFQAAAFAALVLWALAACFRSITDSTFALKSLVMTLGTVLVGAVVMDAARRLDDGALAFVLRALALGLAVAVGIVLVCAMLARSGLATFPPLYKFIWHVVCGSAAKAWSHGLNALIPVLTRMDRGATLVALLIWPACLGLWRAGERRACLGLALATVAALLMSFALAAKIALLLGGICALLVWCLPRVGVRVILAGVLGILLLAPVGASHLPPPEESIKWPGMVNSAHHRMTIWTFAADRIAQHPFIGWGFEASRTIGGKAEVEVTRPNGEVLHEALMPLHPHNAALQLWLELGGIGAGLMALFLAASILRLTRSGDRLMRAYMAAGVTAATFIAVVSFGFWQSWWQCSLWLCAALLVAQARPSAPRC